VKKIVVEHLGVEPGQVVRRKLTLSTILAAKIPPDCRRTQAMAFEEEFGVEIPDDAAEKYL